MTQPIFAEAAAAASLVAYKRHFGSWIGSEPEVGPRHEFMMPMSIDGEYPLSSGAVIEGMQLVDGTWVGAHHYYKDGPCDGLKLQDCDLTSHHKWASRSYDMRHMNLVDWCSFRNVYDEHGIYWNLRGYDGGFSLEHETVLIRHSLFENIGSQAIQFVQYGREDETLQPGSAMTPGGPIKLRGNLIRNAGYNRSGNARASFAVSFFPGGQDVDFGATFVDNSMQATSRGAFLCHGGAGRDKVRVGGSQFLMGILQQPMYQIYNIPSVEIEHCTMYADGGQDWLDIRGCPDVHVHDCAGTTRIKLDGVDVGSVEGGFRS